VAHQPNPRGRGEGQVAPLSAADTIAAIATPGGRGGIGIVRVSGPKAQDIAKGVLGTVPAERRARHATFRAGDDSPIDEGLALFFPGPGSYTGEDVLELQGHGGPVVMRRLLERCLELGARVADPGEFTRRAFLNDRIDLAQAESVADLIDAATEEAARSAARSLTGEFSRRVDELLRALVDLRMHVEACIDFPEEDIDPDDRSAQAGKLDAALRSLEALLADAEQGAVLREGLEVVLVGAPNVGKSSLLNRLAGADVAIVTPVPGTTRDYVRATIAIEGVPIHLIDTAGLRDTSDEVERIGVERTWRAVANAGAALFVTAAGTPPSPADESIRLRLAKGIRVATVRNKIDLTGQAPTRTDRGAESVVEVSAKTGAGIDMLRRWLLEAAGWRPHGEGIFVARARHLRALRDVRQYLLFARENMQVLELMAEELRLAQLALSAVTGGYTTDDLLGEIFSKFCLGK
jgi:tRNA modification GTPase